ncbi:coiled-coil domain-containing protein 73 isoform X2 [Anarrhichthys ocellatus]|uniref:coiled-coil domain-containing protein 73 isoform X2 n=1 Tax=Anarrhichthys ocellatus TaxID=433405 RepID=UPI0012EE11B3|nr:coiled-coil domain-containing protein 73 isoform X2 [Anarrhichthys ocellatus]
MDLSADSGTLPTHTAHAFLLLQVGGPAMEQELSLSNARCQTESGGTILLQLLEFKTHLLEAVEELHIRRDAETRFEGQISKLVLEKQELEWEKESLQHQIETVSNQHTQSLINVKKQLQAKIRNIEEEKGKYQVSAELKDKEINNLKEELKSLQLLKYNLEKRSSELKLALQSRSKDSHLNQLGEVEKRFCALSRQCAMVKQAHEKLEQNVDEAMKIKKNLTTANAKQEATIVSLKKELEEVSHKLIKAKMSSVRHDEAHSATGREQHCQQLHQKLNMETKMNKKLREENVAVRAEKQDVMRSLQHTQQLLLSQTQTVSRAERELQSQREQYQALKQEQRVMRERSKATEDKVAQLMESNAASKHSWDKEKVTFLDCIKSERQDLRAVKEAYEELRQENMELSSQTKVHAQHIYELEMRDEGIRGEGTNEPISSSELPSFGSLQPLASAQTNSPDRLEDTGVVTQLDTTGATGVSTVVSHGHMCVDGSVDSLIKEKSDEGMSEREQRWKDDEKRVKLNRSKRERNGDGEDAKEGGSAAEKSGTLGAQTTDRADRREGTHGSPEDAGGGPKQPETETKDRAEGEGTYGAEERGKTALHAAETQIAAQTTTDTTTKNSDTQQVFDLTDTEPPTAACEPSDRSQSLLQNVSEEDADSCRLNEGYETPSVLCRSHEPQGVNHGPNCVVQEVQRLCHDEVQTFAESATPSPVHHVLEKTTEEKPSKKSAANMSTGLSGPLNQSRICSSQINNAPSAAQLDVVRIQELGTTQTQPSDPSDIPSDMKQTDALPPILDISEPSGQPKSLVTDGDGDSSACKEREGQSNVDAQEQDDCETAQEPTDKHPLKDACADTTMDTADLETSSSRERVLNDKIDDAGDAKTTKTEADLKPSVHPAHESDASPESGGSKCYEPSPAKEPLHDGTNEGPLLSNKTYRSSFDWGSAQRRAGSSRDESDVSVLHQFVQGSPSSEQNTSGPGGLLRHPPSTIPMFLKSKHEKVPLVITRASDLLNASSVSGTAASAARRRQGGRGALGKTCGETATADTESRASLSIPSFPVSRLPLQSTPGCSRAPTSAAGPSSESDWGPVCSQEREDQQSSFRAQISKIEQFLNTERLRLPKRRRTDN